MKLFSSAVPFFAPPDLLPEGTVLFDIETTGLSADTSYLYLIGVLCSEGGRLICRQWFCDSYSEEKELLLSFADFLSNVRTMIQYNGSTFDIPYLNKKWKRHRIPMRLDASATLDYYKLLLPYKRLLPLPDLRLKTVEAAAGFLRSDTFDGADLISVYTAYTGKYRLAELTGVSDEADALRAVLLLHNHDDLLGLLRIHLATRLSDLLEGSLPPKQSLCTALPTNEDDEPIEDRPRTPACSPDDDRCASGVVPKPEKTERRLSLTWEKTAFPVSFSCDFSFGSLTNTAAETVLRLTLSDGTLRYFFSDYREYYYLPLEDTAIHSSLAEFVAPQAKQRCTPATAYQNRRGCFLPLPPASRSKSVEPTGLPLFFAGYRTLPAYVEYSERLFAAPDFTRTYLNALFTALAKGWL